RARAVRRAPGGRPGPAQHHRAPRAAGHPRPVGTNRRVRTRAGGRGREIVAPHAHPPRFLTYPGRVPPPAQSPETHKVLAFAPPCIALSVTSREPWTPGLRGVTPATRAALVRSTFTTASSWSSPAMGPFPTTAVPDFSTPPPVGDTSESVYVASGLPRSKL